MIRAAFDGLLRLPIEMVWRALMLKGSVGFIRLVFGKVSQGILEGFLRQSQAP